MDNTELKKIKEYFSQAIKYKDDIKSNLNEVIKYTSEYGRITDTEDSGLESRAIDPSISDAVDSLQNFIMNTVFGVKTAWAKFEVSEAMLKKEYQGAELIKIIETLSKALDENTKVVFDFLFDTNYYSEVTKAVRDCSNLGTGCYRVIPLKATANPFTFRYVDLNELYFLEDYFGLPNIVFQKHYSQNATDIQTKWIGAKLPVTVSLSDISKKINILETVTPLYNEKNGLTTYNHVVLSDDFRSVLLEEELEYNPYKVFRFSTINNNPWGKGVGTKALDSFKRLHFYKSMRAKQVKKIVDPSIGFIGDKLLALKLNLNAGATNWLGDGTSKAVDVRNIGVHGNLMPIDEDIATIKNEIRDLYMAKPFGDVNQEGAKSTVEIQRRFELFRQRYAGTSELFYNELLKPTFQAPYRILEKNKILEMPKGIDEFVNLRFVNQLTKASLLDEVSEIIEFAQVVQQTFPQYFQFTFKPSMTILEVAKKMGIDSDLLNSKDEIEQAYKQAQAQAQALALQQLGSGQNAGVEGTEQVAKQITQGGAENVS